MSEIRIEAYLFIFAALSGLVIIPFVTFRYLAHLGRVRDDLAAKLAGAFQEYYDCFHPSDASTERKDKDKFKADFNRLYGARKYIFPLIILLVLVVLGFTFIGFNLWPMLNRRGDQTLLLTHRILIFTILGGYVWALADLLERRYMNDLTPNSFYWMGFRMLAAIPIGYTFSKTFGDSLLIAFFASSFPASTIRRYGMRIFQKTIDQKDTGEAAGELSCIQGISQSTIERLEEEGIRTVQQLACADPVRLLIRSNFEFAYIVDWIDQAILHLYLGDHVKELRPVGIRTALELKHLYDMKELIPLVAKRIGLKNEDEILLKKTLYEVANDPYVGVLNALWAYDHSPLDWSSPPHSF